MSYPESIVKKIRRRILKLEVLMFGFSLVINVDFIQYNSARAPEI